MMCHNLVLKVLLITEKNLCNFQYFEYLFIIQYFYAQTMYDILVQVNKRCANDDLRCSCSQKGTLAVCNGTLNTYSILLCLGNYLYNIIYIHILWL